MKNTLKFEELGMLLLSILLFYQLNYTWWVYLIWFFVPDIGMLGYLFNTRVGAVTYNIFHHKGIAIIIYIIGIVLQNQELQLAGIILFGHSSFDRMLGYGLKYPDSFQNTHLGKIGS